jgi:hypothetical protein
MFGRSFNRQLKFILWHAVAAASIAAPHGAFAQGCVAARGAGITDAHTGALSDQEGSDSGLETSLGYRWFKSGRHYVGDVEQTIRERQQTQVKNNSNFLDLGISYAVNQRLRLALAIPFAVHSRSQVIRDAAGNNLDRFATESSGLGDLRLTGDIWILDPKTKRRWNMLVGAGFSAPTGNPRVKDVFEVYDSATRRIYARDQPVDESIQLGIGGWGIPIEFYGFVKLTSRLQAYAEGFYSITPKNTNGVPTNRSNPFEATISVADSYMSRAGVNFNVLPLDGVSASLGLRIEGVPVHDLVGSSEGFRRPGYAMSIEPGLSAQFGSWSLNLFTPVAVYRNRLQSVSDKEQTAATGVYQHGDAAFADFSIISSISKRW